MKTDFQFHSQQRLKYPVLSYVLASVLHIGSYFAFVKSPTLGFLVITAISCVHLLFTKNMISLDLIGIKWYTSSKGVSFYSRPDPFIPDEFGSNAFWVISVANAAAWALISLFNLIRGLGFSLTLSLIGFITTSINLYLLSKGFSITQEAYKATARNALLDPGIEFEEAQPDGSPNEVL